MAEKKEAKVAKESAKEAVKEPVAGAQGTEQGHFVFIGKKGAMAYVLAVITHFGEGAQEVVIKARGKSISHAVDVAEIVKNKSAEVHIKAINTSTEEVVTMDGRPLKVSAIEIVLARV